MSKRNRKPKKGGRKPKTQPKRSGGGGGSSSFLDKIPGLIKDVASIGSIVSGFMGTPVGAMSSGSRSGGFNGVKASQLVTAPATTGLMSRMKNWDLRAAPDVGYGPGIRMSGRLQIGQVVGSITLDDSTTQIRYFGIAPNAAVTAPDGEIKIDNAPLSFVVLSPVAPFSPSETPGQPDSGVFGSAENIIQRLASTFQRYKVVDATIVYAPDVGSQDQHTLSLGWLPDAGIILKYAGVYSSSLAVPAIKDPNFVMSIPDSVTWNAWMPMSFVIPLDKSRDREALFVNDINLSAEGPSDPDAIVNSLEARQLFEGGFVITGFGVDSEQQALPAVYTLGTLFADLTIDLYQMALDSQPNLYTGSSSTSLSSSVCCSSTSSSDVKEEKRPQVLAPFVPFPRKRVGRPDVGHWLRAKQHMSRLSTHIVNRGLIPDTGEPVDMDWIPTPTNAFSIPGTHALDVKDAKLFTPGVRSLKDKDNPKLR
jgi:hypothetical protein